MAIKTERTIDYAAWVKRANARWITHYSLSLDAEAYMNHLTQVDARRLLASSHNAYLMVWQHDQREDPKPWFYSGLFSLATEDEARKFLAEHWLTRCVTALSMDFFMLPFESMNEITLEKIRRLRGAVAKLPDFPPGSCSYGDKTNIERRF
jgi:hypothetical protein